MEKENNFFQRFNFLWWWFWWRKILNKKLFSPLFLSLMMMLNLINSEKKESKTDWLFVCLYRELFSKLGQTCHRSDECSSSGVSSSGSSGSNDQWRRFDLNEAFTFEPLSVSDLGEIYAEIEVFNNRNKQVLGKVSANTYQFYNPTRYSIPFCVFETEIEIESKISIFFFPTNPRRNFITTNNSTFFKIMKTNIVRFSLSLSLLISIFQ